jgi:uncharacterized protein with PQ loop repeat
MVAVALIAPFALLPQVLRIYENKDAVDLSMLTWGTLLGVHFLWVLYGAAHREKPILIAHTLVFFFNSAIVVGILLYG